MKVLILGGCADMAVPLNNILKNDAEVKSVTLADLNIEKAQKLASELGSKFSGTKVDAMDHSNLVSTIQGYDVVLAYIGPFYVFEKKMAKAAIEAKVHYVSIADDYDAYLDVITLEEEAKAANVKVLTGFGNSPGITQILARKGYNDVQNTYKIHVNWCAGSSEDVGISNLTHLFHIFNGTTLQWFNGQEKAVKTGTAKKMVEFPDPIGKNPVYYTGHAESVSLPRNLPGLKEVTLHGGVKPNYIVQLVKTMSTLRLFSTHKRRTKMANLLYKIEGWFASEGVDKSVGRIDIFGKGEGKDLYKHFTYVGHIADITSLPAYLAAKWLFKGKFDKLPGGVYAPERLLEDPTDFIEELRKLGVDIKEYDIQEL